MRPDASSVPRAGLATRTMRSKFGCLRAKAAFKAASSARWVVYSLPLSRAMSVASNAGPPPSRLARTSVSPTRPPREWVTRCTRAFAGNASSNMRAFANGVFVTLWWSSPQTPPR
jgi:hypothetical protein